MSMKMFTQKSMHSRRGRPEEFVRNCYAFIRKLQKVTVVTYSSVVQIIISKIFDLQIQEIFLLAEKYRKKNSEATGGLAVAIRLHEVLQR